MCTMTRPGTAAGLAHAHGAEQALHLLVPGCPPPRPPLGRNDIEATDGDEAAINGTARRLGLGLRFVASERQGAWRFSYEDA